MTWSTIKPEYQQLANKLLTQKQLQVLQLRINGHTWTTIAYYTNTTTATARGHYHAALRKLKPHITKEPT